MTVEVLAEHRVRYEEQVRQLGIKPRDDAYLFSHKPGRDVPYDPSVRVGTDNQNPRVRGEW